MTTPHPHGTRARYLTGCACPPCHRANADYAKRYRLRTHGNRDAFTIPAGPAVEHVRHLRSLGMSTAAIAEASGLPRGTIRNLARGQARTHRETADAVLAVTPASVNTGYWVGATGTARRLQALHALGYTWAELAAAIPHARAMMLNIVYGRQEYVTGRTADRVRRLYDQWAMRVPTSDDRIRKGHITRARSNAAANGWPPPLAWDDDTIDDPAARPARVRPERGTFALDDAVMLINTGSTWADLTKRLGVTRDAIDYRLRREGRADLVHLLAERDLPMANRARVEGTIAARRDRGRAA